VSATVAIVWPCPLSVEEYRAAGRGVQVPRVDCPDCGQPMVFWSGYQRYVRVGRVWRVWVARARCRSCRVTHALLPSFLLLRRLDVVWVIGAALERVGAGAGLRPVAAGLGVPHTTVRDWWRRLGVRAPVLAAGLCALVVELGGLVDGLPGVPQCAALAALAALDARVGQRLGAAAPATWPLAAIVSGGGWLGATTSPPWAGGGRRGWLPPESRSPPS
jgi:transposase-like protein